MIKGDRGDFSEVLMMMTFPAATAGAALRIVIPKGAFHGIIPAQTPNG